MRMGAADLAFAREEPGLTYALCSENVGALATPESGEAADKALAVPRQACAAVLADAGAAPRVACKSGVRDGRSARRRRTPAAGGHLDPKHPGRDPAPILQGGVDGPLIAAIRAGAAGAVARRPSLRNPLQRSSPATRLVCGRWLGELHG